jgi:hypothetical protein
MVEKSRLSDDAFDWVKDNIKDTEKDVEKMNARKSSKKSNSKSNTKVTKQSKIKKNNKSKKRKLEKVHVLFEKEKGEILAMAEIAETDKHPFLLFSSSEMAATCSVPDKLCDSELLEVHQTCMVWDIENKPKLIPK